MATTYMIRPLPAGNSPAARIERSHLQASRWAIPGVGGDGAIAGKVYSINDPLVASNLSRKGFIFCDQSGKPVVGEAGPAADEKAAEKKNASPAIRAGTEEWYALPPDQRFGTEEYREAELQRKLDEEWQKEQADAVAAVQPREAGSEPQSVPREAGATETSEPLINGTDEAQRRGRR